MILAERTGKLSYTHNLAYILDFDRNIGISNDMSARFGLV